MIVDDHLSIIKSLTLFLNATEGFKVVSTCKDGLAALKKEKLLHPDIILLDMNMPGMDGLETAKNLLAGKTNSGIIGMSVDNNPEYARKLIALGAKGFLTKTSTPEEFIEAIKQVMNGKIYICKEIKGR
jgi:two-component system, NarL family, invasion response regulator UvrY